MAIPNSISDAELAERLNALVAAEDALRLVGVTGQSDGLAFYADSITPELVRHEVSSEAEISTLLDRESAECFPRSGRPLWRAHLVNAECESAAARRFLLVVLDHLISDAVSLDTFRKSLLEDNWTVADRIGKYRNWVNWQRETFRHGVKTVAQEFWLEHLGGTAPQRAIELPFLTTDKTRSGIVEQIMKPVNVTERMLLTASRRFKASSFAIVVSAAAAATSEASKADDITLRVITSARTEDYYRTVGWFSDCIPIRLADDALADPLCAVERVKNVWWDILKYSTTPWPYIVSSCNGDRSSAGNSRLAQLTLNFVPYAIFDDFSRAFRPKTRFPGNVSGLDVALFLDGSGTIIVQCIYDTAWMTERGADHWLMLFESKLRSLCQYNDAAENTGAGGPRTFSRRAGAQPIVNLLEVVH